MTHAERDVCRYGPRVIHPTFPSKRGVDLCTPGNGEYVAFVWRLGISTEWSDGVILSFTVVARVGAGKGTLGGWRYIYNLSTSAECRHEPSLAMPATPA